MKTFLFFCFCLAFSSANATITYQVDRVIGDGFVTGTITTDGTLGNLFTEVCDYDGCSNAGGRHIIDWDLYLFDGTGSARLGRGDSLWTFGYQPGGSNFWATPSSLLYDFSSSGFALFQKWEVVGYGSPYWLLDQGFESLYAGPDSMSNVDWDEIHAERNQIRYWPNEQIVGRAITASVSEPGALSLLLLAVVGVSYRRRHASSTLSRR